MVFRLNDELIFPNPTYAEEDGLLAVGGDLSIERLLLAYQQGIFPWYSEGEPILWYAPKERFVLFPKNLKVSKSLQNKISRGRFTITQNQAFEQVIDQCAQVKRTDQDGTWITNEMRTAYIALHQKGIAQSVEIWEGEELVGGLYGVVVGRVFCGESMFHTVADASKIALTYLVKTANYQLIDCQVYTDHLASLGAEFISMKAYQSFLK